jgi:parallel beta-helix repeat protein
MRPRRRRWVWVPVVRLQAIHTPRTSTKGERMRKLLTLVVVALAGWLISAAPAFAVTRWVNDDQTLVAPPGSSCTSPGYRTIQDAVNASVPNDTINVCTGTYSEVVVVGAGKNNLTLRSVTPLAAVIQAPPTIALDVANSKSIVRVTVARNVTIREFTITGPGPAGCDSIRYGVRVDGNGSANVVGNHVADIRDNPFSGCQNGVGIQIGRQFEGQVGSALIAGNRIDGYQKNGLTVDNTGSRALVYGNIVTGAGPTPITAQNGIQVSRGATADVRFNRVTDNAYSLAVNGVFSATGILLYQNGASTFASNSAARNDDNLGAYGTSGNRISDNRFTDSSFYDGIYMGSDTANNRIDDNFLRGNTEHDCHDDSNGPNNPPALVANLWTDNDGVTENRVGLCRTDDDDDDDDHGHDHGHHHHESHHD